MNNIMKNSKDNTGGMFNRNIFNNEFKRLIRPTIYWSLVIVVLIYVDMFFYLEMQDSGIMNKAVDFMKNPFMESMMKGFGINPEQMSDPLGFFATRNTMIELLLGSIFAVMYGSSLISLEEREKTSEFLLSKPVTRAEILSSKLLSFHFCLFLLNFSATLFGLISLEIFSSIEYSRASYFVLCIYTYLLTIIFSSLSLFLSLLVKRGRVFMGMMIGIVLGTYFLDIISNISESARFLGYFSPFKYVDKAVLNSGYGLEPVNLGFFVFFSCLFVFLSFKYFRKKDIMV